MRLKLLSPHKVGTAGRFFDEHFAQLKGAEIIDVCRRKSFGSAFFEVLFGVFLTPIFGYHSALYLIRCFRVRRKLEDCDELILSRSIAPLVLLRIVKNKKISVLVHNIESLYYREEAEAEKAFPRKVLNWHQSVVLSLCEMPLLARVKSVICISRVESRFIQRAGIINRHIGDVINVSSLAIRRDNVLNWNIIPTDNLLYIYNKNKAERPRRLCFFGDFKNVRNRQLAKSLLRTFPDLVLFGRHGDYLSGKLRNRYAGKINNFKAVTEKFVLVLTNCPRAGVQTKVVHWLKEGGDVVVSRKVARRVVDINSIRQF